MNRILVISEATYLTTGYSKYCESLIKGLLQADIGVVAEMAMYAEVGDPRNGSMPWKIYPVIPHEKDPNRQIYDSDPQAAFGRHTFDAIVADFKPTHVITIQDFWYNNYIDFSPLRKTFNWIWMPTVDAVNQNPEWLDAYSRVDALVTYTDFSKDVLEKEGNLFVHGEAPFAASETFYPMSKAECKKSWGINPESKIIGFVSRNQRRKLFGDLLYSFGQFVKRGQVNDTLLWLHTSFPDKSGWNLPRQIMENEICSKVLLTYYCPCGNIFASHFSGAKGFCSRCQQWSANTSNVGGFIPDSEMARLLNSLDLYVQYSNSEGAGLGAVQVAACGVPIVEVNYSAMEDISTKLEGYKVPYNLYEEIETGCYRAVPDNEETIKIFEDFFSMPATIRKLKGAETRENYIKHYSWDKTIARWKQVIESLPPKNHTLKTHEPAQPREIGSNSDFVKWVITEVLGEPDRLGSYFELKMLRDLNYGSTTSIPGTYLNEDSHAFAGGERRPYGRKEAYEFCYNMRLRNNSIIKNIQEI